MVLRAKANLVQARARRNLPCQPTDLQRECLGVSGIPAAFQHLSMDIQTKALPLALLPLLPCASADALADSHPDGKGRISVLLEAISDLSGIDENNKRRTASALEVSIYQSEDLKIPS